MMSSMPMRGMERNVVAVLPYLKAQGLDIRFCTLSTRRDSALVQDFEKTGVERFDLGAKRLLDRQAWKKFAKMLKQEKIDIIHAQDQDTILMAGFAHWRLKAKTVMSRHVLVELAGNWRRKMRRDLVLNTARRRMDKVVAVSEAVRQDFANLANVPLDKIITIYNGLDVDKFDIRSRRQEKRLEMGWADNEQIVIMVAALTEGKGHDLLIKAIPQVKAAVPNVRIMLAGKGSQTDSIKALAEPYMDMVEFLGERNDIPELLVASDVLVQTSWAEALPTALMEAGAASLPVVATDVGGSAEIVVNCETGYIVPKGDADAIAQRLADVLNQPDSAALMGQKARQRIVDQFSLEQQAKQTIALYERIISGK
jgi:glycosyltransferase involved in cell wall biosynthesis